jgi:hypothetical protein
MRVDSRFAFAWEVFCTGPDTSILEPSDESG